MLELPQAAYGMLWNTRWMDQVEESRRIWYGLGSQNQLLPSAQSIMLLGRFLKDSMVACEAPKGMMAFASISEDGSQMTLFVVNKGLDRAACPRIEIEGGRYELKEGWVYSGSGPDDLNPALRRLTEGLPGALEACSLTILEYGRK